MKTIEQHFCDWESSTFGYGYGTGEEHILKALKDFLALTPEANGCYDYEKLEAALTPVVAWLMITALGKDDKITYGSSPRFGWLTKEGLVLRQFVRERTVEQLAEATWQGDNYVHCYDDHCNCDDGDCRSHNPFWKER